ncbi:MAG: metalloregulator ArsR/SmtB family transcription factor [Gammaproteobacteria bacterium]|uniref:ArsR/SmtB family transcription factor n=1 Tax=Rhodoferax sp. TaxID=50421 RepID=UPI0017CC6888|nr:metalloregulator ArsR/SmtB family transcription factor [Rhodoferax sp.]MBU3899550.1 metalloregulator ArsR/SmtB family transcription factor [Gammaproteobacteria bacterium]MBA3059621.1 metalloregulator ArsR/SmtB family transcription factor [Rhodoferax sp.]MBU3997081.1 metalloregulator ArsR/SmtB family transcription factor [Gammaproteobacteria bacterium]MBU4018026.1 metalloregulator ArsR/SmtB family transcription factor [Gammaproteobacteria bacterium]MBU4080283.1 metalloregulator ArsR/SmtB fam
MNQRLLKDTLYEQVARIGKAVSSPKRLELLELLAQGEKTVEALACELSADIKLTSAHLRVLKEARLVTSRRDGKYIIYQLAGNDIAGLWVNLREVAEEHLLELKMALRQMMADPAKLSAVGREALLDQARRGEVVVIDVRPLAEYATAHLPFARSMPLAEIEQRLAELPSDTEIVAYCRGPFCLLSDEAVALLAAKGYRVRKIFDGVIEWQAAGLAVVHPEP